MKRTITGGLVALLLLAGCGSSKTPTYTAPAYHNTAPAPSSTVDVLYEVEGTTTAASITAQTPTGTSQQDVAVPMKRTNGSPGIRYAFEPGDFVYISAQNKRSSGTVICRISVGGHVISENSASGAYVIATCKGEA